MKEIQRTIKRYSTSFKQKVISEIESGKLTKSEAQRLYGIGGSTSIGKWIRKFGKLHLLNKVVRIELKDEVSRLKLAQKSRLVCANNLESMTSSSPSVLRLSKTWKCVKLNTVSKRGCPPRSRCTSRCPTPASASLWKSRN